MLMSSQDSYPKCLPSSIKSWRMLSENNKKDGQVMKFLSLIVKNWPTNMFTGYDGFTCIFVCGTSVV